MYDGAEIFGVMDYDHFKQMTIDIAAGRYKPSEEDPQKWFASFSALAKYARARAEKNEKIAVRA